MAVTDRVYQCVDCLSRDLEVIGRAEADEVYPDVEIYKCRTCLAEFDNHDEAVRGWPYRRFWKVEKFDREEGQSWADVDWYVNPPIGYRGKYSTGEMGFKGWEDALHFAFTVAHTREGLSRA